MKFHRYKLFFFALGTFQKLALNAQHEVVSPSGVPFRYNSSCSLELLLSARTTAISFSRIPVPQTSSVFGLAPSHLNDNQGE